MILLPPKLDTDKSWTPHARGLLERRIVWNLIHHLKARGWEPRAVNDGDDLHLTNGDAIKTMEAVFAVDDSAIGFCLIAEHATQFRNTKVSYDVQITLGNGEDCITDYNYREGDPDGFSAAMDAFKVEDYLAEPDITPLVAALRRSADLLEDAMEHHIYDEANGEKPAPDCAYTAHVAELRALIAQVTGAA